MEQVPEGGPRRAPRAAVAGWSVSQQIDALEPPTPLISHLQVTTPEQVVLRQVIDVVIPGLEALAQRYDQAVTHLAGLSPQV